MISPKTWNDFGISIKDRIPELKGFIKVKEEAHLNKDLQGHSEFPVLVFVDLSAGVTGANADASWDKHTALAFILDEADSPSKGGKENELNSDELTHGITEQFKSILKSKKDGTGNPCSFLHRLEYNTIFTDPVYNYAKCNGWAVTFEF